MRRFLAVFGAMWVLLWLACTGFFSVALNDEIYFLAQQRAGVTAENARFSDEDRLTLNRETAMYLAGRGEAPGALSERARLHMADVRALFDLLRACMYGFLIAGAAMIALSGRAGRRCFPRLYWIAAAICAASVVLFGAFNFGHFQELFLRFHETLFTNDLWLLNPAEDALIRIMPQAFFENMAVYALIGIGARWILGGALITAAHRLTGRKNQA